MRPNGESIATGVSPGSMVFDSRYRSSWPVKSNR